MMFALFDNDNSLIGVTSNLDKFAIRRNLVISLDNPEAGRLVTKETAQSPFPTARYSFLEAPEIT